MTYMGQLNGAFIDTAMITSVLKTNEKKKSQNKTQTTEDVVANVKYVVSNIRLVAKLAGVLPSLNCILKFKKKENQKETEEEGGTLIPRAGKNEYLLEIPVFIRPFP